MTPSTNCGPGRASVVPRRGHGIDQGAQLEPQARPLDGIRVVELSIAIAAPSCGRTLAYFGADVMKLESQGHPDVVRLFGSSWARTPELSAVFTDTSPYLPEMNAGKRSVGLNLKAPAALDAAKRLIAKADVFITNYSTPAVADLGLDPATLRALNPALVYIALPAFGSDPSLPYYPFISWGPNQAPLVGLDEMTGFPDQEPAGVSAFAPPDYFAALHAFSAVLTALEARERSGEGCWVDISQFEVTVSALNPYLIDEQLSGTVATRSGNRVDWYAPQGVYPCRGEDRWVAVSVQDDVQWAALAELLDEDGGLAGDEALRSLAGRQAAHDRLDDIVAAWTSSRSAEECAERLQRRGIAASAVHDTEAMLVDPQLREYRWYQVQPSLRFPQGDLFGGCAMHLEGTPGLWDRGSPSMGEHTREALTEVAGMTAAEVDELVDEGAAYLPNAPELHLTRPYDRSLGILRLREVSA